MALSLNASDQLSESYRAAVVLFYHSFQNGRNFRKIVKFVRGSQKVKRISLCDHITKDRMRIAKVLNTNFKDGKASSLCKSLKG